MKTKSGAVELIILIAVCMIFAAHTLILEHTQDDAFITYRYVENFLEGHGLVFNYGEKVEGYTNFLWLIILSCTTLIGLPIIIASKVLGVACGMGTLILSFLMAREMTNQKHKYVSLIPPLLLSLNGAFAYWVIGGLETGLFVFLVTLSIYCELKRSTYTPAVLVMATLTRPEGGLIFLIILVSRIVIGHQKFKDQLSFFVVYAIPMVVYAVFKLLYYGDLLPNPFYAKTSSSWESLRSGLEYLWLFSCHYGIFGVLFLLPLAAIRALDKKMKLVWMIILIYTVYIVMVGGDVLKVHRFFLPLLPLLYLTLAFVFSRALSRIAGKRWLVISMSVLLLAFTVWMVIAPGGYIRQTRKSEMMLIWKMNVLAADLKRIDDSDFSLATSTIGKAAYVLKGHKVIDMLGLTDPEIAKHPETIEGFVSSWKERNFNSGYLLGLKPDYILFSTGYKPSAPAELALFLNSQFRRNYTTIVFMRGKLYDPVWKRTGNFPGPNRRYESVEYANLINEGLNLQGSKEYTLAIEKFRQALMMGDNDFSILEFLMGRCFLMQKQGDSMLTHFYKALEIDSNNLEVYMLMYKVYDTYGDVANQLKMQQKIKTLAPWIKLD